jgi:hypothetical protein
MTYDITQADVHRPTEAFRDFLEEEVARGFRHGRAMRRIRLAAVVLLSVALGTTGGLASAQIRESSQRDSLLEAAQADATLVQARLGLAKAKLEDARRMVAIGMATPEWSTGAELEVRQMEAQLARVAANINEIKATSQAPRDELNAPVVNGRDFVKDRIQYRLMAAQQQLQAAEAAQAEAARRVRVGAATELESLEPDLSLARARRDFAVLAERLALRKEFLERGTPIDQLTRRLEQAELRQDVVVAQRSLEVARTRAAALAKRKAVGAVGELELMKAQVELKEREIELDQLWRRLRDVGRAAAASPGKPSL